MELEQKYKRNNTFCKLRQMKLVKTEAEVQKSAQRAKVIN